MTGIHKDNPRILRQRRRDKWFTKHQEALSITIVVGTILVAILLMLIFF